MEQSKHHAQFQNEQEWQEALKGKFEGLHSKIAELIGDKNILLDKCDKMENLLKEIHSSPCDYEDYYRKLHSPKCRACKAWELLKALSGEGEKEGEK